MAVIDLDQKIKQAVQTWQSCVSGRSSFNSVMIKDQKLPNHVLC